MKLWNEIRSKMLRNPVQTVAENHAEMTYEELTVFAESFAQKLREETCCAILCRSEMAAAMALLSCFAAEVTAVPLSMRYGKLHCKAIIDRIHPTALITDFDGTLRVYHVTDCLYEIPENRPALIMCTSGTTGVPKGAMLTEENILTNIGDICEYFHITRKDTILIARPLYHCAVLTGEFLVSLCKGVKIRFDSEAFHPKRILSLIDTYRVTVFGGTPTVLRMMTRFARNGEGRSLQSICISGECLDAETGKRIAEAFEQADMYHVYGLTEAAPRVSALPPAYFAEHCDCVGFPLRSVRMRILRQDGSCAKRGEVGVLWVKGKSIMQGYYGDHVQTAKVLKRGWLCTGDIAVINEEGMLRIMGRNDDLIIRSGMNIYPQEMECALKKDPAVKEVLVYKIEDPLMGVRIGLKIAGDFANVDAVKGLCGRLLSPHQMPSVIELLEELPKNGSGKLLRGGSHSNAVQKESERVLL